MQTENKDHPILRRISDSRRAVLAGGLSILTALFEAFNLGVYAVALSRLTRRCTA